jgi:hypothetical protein
MCVHGLKDVRPQDFERFPMGIGRVVRNKPHPLQVTDTQLGISRSNVGPPRYRFGADRAWHGSGLRARRG